MIIEYHWALKSLICTCLFLIAGGVSVRRAARFRYFEDLSKDSTNEALGVLGCYWSRVIATTTIAPVFYLVSLVIDVGFYVSLGIGVVMIIFGFFLSRILIPENPSSVFPPGPWFEKIRSGSELAVLSESQTTKNTSHCKRNDSV